MNSLCTLPRPHSRRRIPPLWILLALGCTWFTGLHLGAWERNRPKRVRPRVRTQVEEEGRAVVLIRLKRSGCGRCNLELRQERSDRSGLGTGCRPTSKGSCVAWARATVRHRLRCSPYLVAELRRGRLSITWNRKRELRPWSSIFRDVGLLPRACRLSGRRRLTPSELTGKVPPWRYSIPGSTRTTSPSKIPFSTSTTFSIREATLGQEPRTIMDTARMWRGSSLPGEGPLVRKGPGGEARRRQGARRQQLGLAVGLGCGH